MTFVLLTLRKDRNQLQPKNPSMHNVGEASRFPDRACPGERFILIAEVPLPLAVEADAVTGHGASLTRLTRVRVLGRTRRLTGYRPAELPSTAKTAGSRAAWPVRALGGAPDEIEAELP